MDAIFKGNGNVLVLKVEKAFYDARTSKVQLKVAGGAEINTSINNTVIFDQRDMNENDYNDMVKNLVDKLISDNGKVDYYDKSNKELKINNKKFR